MLQHQPILKFQLPDALMLHTYRLASTILTLLLRFKLIDPATDSAFAKLHVITYLADAQTLDFDLIKVLWQQAQYLPLSLDSICAKCL